MRRCVLGLVTALSLMSAGAVAACEGGEVLFEDAFDTLDPTWGYADDAFFVDDGRLTLMPGYDEYYSSLSTMGTYEDIDLCLDVTPLEADAEGNTFAGLMFWAVDYENYYYVVITAEQSIGVFRRQRGRVLPQLRWTNLETLAPGTGAVNRLRVVTSGNTASIYVNDAFYWTIKGQPPSTGQQIGVRATSPRNERAVWAFDNIRITVPASGAEEGDEAGRRASYGPNVELGLPWSGRRPADDASSPDGDGRRG